nr:carboxymuconolactone decarboxylase family protein [Sandaracinus amylolyticus]
MTMRARMKHPAMMVPDAMQALQALGAAIERAGVPRRTLELVNLRASQINGCSFCVEMHSRALKRSEEKDERIFAVAAWRESPHFTPAERAALALTEAITRVADRADPVPDELWREVTHHFDEPALAALVLGISNVNTWNRLNVATRQIAGSIRTD